MSGQEVVLHRDPVVLKDYVAAVLRLGLFIGPLLNTGVKTLESPFN